MRVVLPASGWEMMAKVRRLSISCLKSAMWVGSFLHMGAPWGIFLQISILFIISEKSLSVNGGDDEILSSIAQENGKSIVIIKLEDFLKKLNLSIEELETLDYPQDYLVERHKNETTYFGNLLLDFYKGEKTCLI